MDNDYDDYTAFDPYGDDNGDDLHDMEESVMARDGGRQDVNDEEFSDLFFDDEA